MIDSASDISGTPMELHVRIGRGTVLRGHNIVGGHRHGPKLRKTGVPWS